MKKFIFVLLLVLSCNLSVFAEKINKKMVEAETLKNGPAVILAKLRLDNASLTHKAYFFNKYLPKVNFVTGGRWGTKTELGTTLGATNKCERPHWNKVDFVTGRRWGTKTELGTALGATNKCERPHWNKDRHCLSASVTIPLGFDTYSDTKDNLDTFKAEKLAYEQSVAEAIFESNKLYLDLIAAYEGVTNAKRVLERCVESRDLIKLKYNSGDATIDLLQDEEDGVLQAERSLEKMQEEAKELSENLLVAMGRNNVTTVLEIDEQIVIPKKIIEKPDYDSLITKTTEFLTSQNAFEKSKASKTKINSKWLPLPSVSLEASYTPDMCDNCWANKKETFGVSIGVSYPIFTGLGRYFDSKKASNNLQVSSMNFSKETDALKKKAKKLYEGLVDAFKQLKIATDKLNSSEFHCEIAKKKFINGFGKYYDWRNAEYVFASAQTNLLSKKKDIAVKIAEWRKFTGDDSMEGEEE